MSFKEQLQKDIEKVFFNADEFSEIHTIDGKEVRAIIDNLELLERAKSSIHTDGIYTSQTLIYIPKVDYGARPPVGKKILLDGKKHYKIVEVVEENGVYSLTLEVSKV